NSVAIGAASGAVTFGIGTGFDNLSTAAVEAGKASKVAIIEAGRLATHATFQGGLSAAQGGDFWSAFASGAAGGLVGLGTEGLRGTGGDLATIGSAMLLGGFTSEAEGGDFWKGAAQAGIVARANAVAHRASETPEEKLARKIRRAQRRVNRQNRGSGMLTSINGMVLDTSNPYNYSPSIYFSYTNTGNGTLVYYGENGVTTIKIDAKGNIMQSSSKVGPEIDVGSFVSNKGFTQLPFSASQSSINQALGDYADDFSNFFTDGDGMFLTNKPFKAISDHIFGNNPSDITFRFRTSFEYNGNPYQVVLDINYD
ncbi:MAG: hypothetical protein ACFB2Y_23595, partial [Fulvivirga sp.]